MTETRRTQESKGAGGHRGVERTAWVGWIMFAGVMMVILGVIEAIEGLVALLNDDYYLVAGKDLIVSVDYTTWGWVHLILGIVIAGAGLGVMVGQMWARVVGILFAGLSVIVNIGFLSAYPVWSAIVIAIDVLVIYALTVHGKETRSESY